MFYRCSKLLYVKFLFYWLCLFIGFVLRGNVAVNNGPLYTHQPYNEYLIVDTGSTIYCGKKTTAANTSLSGTFIVHPHLQWITTHVFLTNRLRETDRARIYKSPEKIAIKVVVIFIYRLCILPNALFSFNPLAKYNYLNNILIVKSISFKS